MSPHRQFGPGLLSLLASVIAYLLWRSLATGSWFVLSGLVWWSCLILALLVLVGPLVWWSRRRVRHRVGGPADPPPSSSAPHPSPEDTPDVREAAPDVRPTILAVAALVFLAELLLLTAPSLAVLSSLEFAWQGKLVTFAAMLVFVALWPGLSRRAVGFTVPGWSGWWPALAVTGVAALFWMVAAAEAPPMNVTAETVLFQATMPSLEEELVWRGILWALLLQALPRTRRFGGQGWPLLITGLGFALIHGFVLSDDFSLTVDTPLLIFSLGAGLALGWVRIRSGSILPAMAAHSGINLAAVIVPG